MDALDLVLSIVALNPEKRIHGRTLLQKQAFFVGQRLGLEVEFQPHYYGPYSSAVANAAETLVAVGFLREQVELFSEARRHTYSLTEEGKAVYEHLSNNDPSFGRVGEEIERMAQSGLRDDYRSLSLAAKVFYIVNAAQGTITKSKIEEEARKLGWAIGDEDVEKAATFLNTLLRS